MKLLQLIDEIKVVGYDGGPVVSISATFLENDELDWDYFTQPQWDYKVLTLREAKLELDKFQRTNSADVFELPLAIYPEFREMGYSLGNAVACLPRPTSDTYYELDGFPGEGYGYQSEYGGLNPGQEWRHGAIFVRVFHPVEITGEDFDSLNEYINFSVYLGSKISFLEAFTRLASKSEINEIAVVPKKYQVFQIPFESVPQDGGGSLMLSGLQMITFPELISLLNEYSQFEAIEVFKASNTLKNQDLNSPVKKAILCMPKPLILRSLPSGFAYYVRPEDVAMDGFLFIVAENTTSDFMKDYIEGMDIDMTEEDKNSMTPQEAIQYLRS